ncbi:putative ribonuclease H-like domain-containing protein [Tanacetum coccineum]
MVPRAVLMKSGLVSVTTARQVNTAHSKITVNAARPMSYLSKIAHSTIKMPILKNTTFKNSNIDQRFNIVSGKNFNTVRPKVVVNAVKGNSFNVVKASACWVWKPKTKVLDHGNLQMDLHDQGVIDSGCSRHMTWNMSYLTNSEEIDGGYVTFGGNLKGGKITGKVKGNLVRGLPSKLFENDQTCVACQKGKQHRASCKSKTENSISLPLHLLHMDLFSPTFLKSLMKKMYCLVVIDDYSSFTWVFFLATKNETSGILKYFISGIENLVDHKVKMIRCDNGIEFKNREMNQFCEMKGILRQFSVARTPQQNKVIERRNRTLIEAARTMLADSKLPTTFWAEVKLEKETRTCKDYMLLPLWMLIHHIQDPKVLMMMDPILLVDDGKKEEPKKVIHALKDPSWIEAIQEELLQFKLQEVWTLVDLPNGKRAIAIRLFLAYASFKDFVVYQMDVKSAFLYRKIEEEVYVCQPPRFEDPDFPNRVYKCKKQTVVANSTIEAEYVAASSCRGQDKAKQSVRLLMEKHFGMELVNMVIKVKFSLHALVDGKKIIVTESTVRRDLQLEDAEELGEGSAIPTDPHHTPTIIESSTQLQKTQKPRKPKRKYTQVPQPSVLVKHVAMRMPIGVGRWSSARTMGILSLQTRFENVSKHSNDSLLVRGNILRSDEDSIKLKELMEIYTTLQSRVLDLEKTKTTQANEIASLKRRVKKLEKKKSLRTYKLKRLYKVGLRARVESFGDEEDLGEDASKQGRRINVIDADEDITLVNIQDDADNEIFDVDALTGDEVFAEQEVVAKDVNLTVDEVTLAQALADLKSVKPKVKGDVIKEPNVLVNAQCSKQRLCAHNNMLLIPTLRKGMLFELGNTTITISSQQSQENGKGIMIEEPVKRMKKKVQIMLDEEVASKLQAKFDEEEKLAREKAKKEKEANIALTGEWDDIQAKIEADHKLAQRLQAEDQEELSDAEKATLFQQLLEKRRKHFVAKRAEEQRKKPPKQAQQRKIMCTYLKNMEGKKFKDLKNKSFDSIQKMFDRAFKRVNTFVDFRIDLVEGSSKRAGEELEQENEEEVTINVVPLAVKSPSIVGWKIYKEGKKSYYQIMRADGKSQMYRIFIHMLKSFSREDLEDLYKLVKAKYESTRPVEDLDLLLWGDLKTMFKPHVEDTIWRNQQDYKVLEWKLYDSCGVHSLRMQHVYIYKLVEKRYPLTPSTITDMLNKKLQRKDLNYALMLLIFKFPDSEFPPAVQQGNFMPLTSNLSFTGLDEFANKPIVENCKAMSSEEESKVVRKSDDSLIIED